MFRIKICGITNVEDAIAAVDAGADAIGLNFYEKSPRCVSPMLAREIASEVCARASCWGVFVNLDIRTVEAIYHEAGLTGIQLHGDEPAHVVAHFAKALSPQFPNELAQYLQSMGIPVVETPNWAVATTDDWSLDAPTLQPTAAAIPSRVIRARRMDDRGVGSIRADLDDCLRAGALPGAVLVDAASPGRYGGTGETVSWVGLIDHPRWLGETPLILAGGLRPENVAEAIRTVRPFGVDVASGVESTPGKKDHAKVRDFVAAARGAF